MADLNGGDPGCTTGVAKRIYDQMIESRRAGARGVGTSPQADFRALAYSAAKGVADEVNATGGLGGGTVDLSAYALLDSPAFINNPTAPTPDGSNPDQIATAGYVDTAVAAVAAAGSSSTRFNRRIFEAAIFPGTFTTDYGGTWSYTNGGPPQQAITVTDQPSPAFYVQQTSAGQWATIDSGTSAIVYANRRPKLTVSAKFGVSTGAGKGIGWTYGDTGGNPWVWVGYGPSAGTAGAAFEGGSGNWVCRCWTGANPNATTVVTGVSSVDGKWHLFSIDYSDPAKIVFSIDSAVVATITTFLPSGNTGAQVAVSAVLNTAGGNGSQIWLASIDLETAYPMNI